MAQRLIEKMELHNNLNPKLWENNQLRPEVEEKLDDIVDQFILELQNNDIPIKVLDARLVGSNASFNYTDNSDLDVHIVANFADTSCDVPVLNLLYNYFKKNFNDKYEISIHGVPVELYVEDINSSSVSNGIYSLYKKEWIKFPEPIEIPDIDITDAFIPYEERYQEIVNSQDVERASDLIDELYLLRKDSIATDGEYGEGNLVFKEFRNKGYLDNLKQLLVDETSKELSLESLNEEAINPILIFNAIKKEFGTSDCPIDGPSFLLPDGTFIDMNKRTKYRDFAAHANAEEYLQDIGLSTSYIEKSGSPTLQDLGAIRLNTLNYNNFIELSDVRPTPAQYKALQIWLDENEQSHSEIDVITPNFENNVTYNYDDYIVDEIISKIKRYYSSGKLYESSNSEKWLNESKEDNQKLVDHVGEETAQEFFKLKPRIKSPQNDLYYWLKKEPVELQSFLDELQHTETRTQRQRREKEGAQLIYDVDRWRVYKILTYEAAKYYGKGTRWCISGNYPDHEGRGEQYFDDYKEDGVENYYFIIHGHDKWCWLEWDNPDLLTIESTLWEADDTGIKMESGDKPNFPDGVIDALPNARSFFDYSPISAEEVLTQAEETGVLIVDYNTQDVQDYYLGSYRIRKVITDKTVPLGWFRGNEYLEEVIIKDPCHYIGRYAFADCPKLKSVYIPASVYLIDDYMVSGSNADLVIYCERKESRQGYAEGCFADVMNQETGELLPANVVWDAPIPQVTESMQSSSIKDHTEAAIRELGKTFYKTRAGFMLKDGSYLDLTYGGHNRSDHRDISAVFDPEEEGYDTASGYLTAFMSEGNIRLTPEVPGIDIQVEPTDAQYQALEDYAAFWLARKGNFVVDLSDERGNIVDAFTYSRGTYPKDIVLDIKEHFEDQHTLDESSEDGDWGYHYGDLGNKADRRSKFGGRGSGGFGTGTYFVGTPISQRKDGGSYKNRPEHKVDFSKYNLFKPRSNEQAYKLHDALLTINNMAPNFKRVPKQWGEVLDEFDEVFDDYYAPLNALDDDDHSTPVTLNKQALLKYIRKYIDYYPYKLNKDDDLMDVAREIENNLVEEAKEFYHILNNLSSALGYYNEDKLRKIVIDALQDKSDVAPATLIMKALGYDGIDVRHLDHDAQGLSGLDNFGFGSVIYDLKEDR